MGFTRQADDGSFKPFEPVPAGQHVALLITSAKASPAVNPHILSLELEDSKGRSMRAKYDQNKKSAKGALAQRFFMNKMLDAVLGEGVMDFEPSRDLEGKFIDAEVTHAHVDKIDQETGEVVLDPETHEPLKVTFANLGTVWGLAEPFTPVGKTPNAADGSDLDAALGL